MFVYQNVKTGEIVDTVKEVIYNTIENFIKFHVITLRWVKVEL